MVKKEVMKNKGNKAEKNEVKFSIDKRFIYGFILVVIIVAVFFVFFDKTTSKIQNDDDLTGKIEEVRARVNGFSVYGSDVERVKEVYQAQTGKEILDEAALDRAISDVLIIQEAEKRGIEATKVEAEQQLAIIAGKQGLSLEQIKKGYENQGKSFDEALDKYVDQLKIEKLANEVASNVPEVTEEEALAYYEENKQSMFENSEVVMPYVQISDQLKLVMEQQRSQNALNEFVVSLRADAEIEYLD